jgi:hypothetical protein
MGWDFTAGATKKDVVNELSDPTRWGEGADAKLLGKKLNGNRLWLVWETTVITDFTTKATKRVRFIEVSILAQEKGFGWGNKTMDHNMGPYYYDCPLAFLDLLRQEDFGASGRTWADTVRGVAARA